jgi:hypothetical protein
MFFIVPASKTDNCGAENVKKDGEVVLVVSIVISAVSVKVLIATSWTGAGGGGRRFISSI